MAHMIWGKIEPKNDTDNEVLNIGKDLPTLQSLQPVL